MGVFSTFLFGWNFNNYYIPIYFFKNLYALKTMGTVELHCYIVSQGVPNSRLPHSEDLVSLNFQSPAWAIYPAISILEAKHLFPVEHLHLSPYVSGAPETRI